MLPADDGHGAAQPELLPAAHGITTLSDARPKAGFLGDQLRSRLEYSTAPPQLSSREVGREKHLSSRYQAASAHGSLRTSSTLAVLQQQASEASAGRIMPQHCSKFMQKRHTLSCGQTVRKHTAHCWSVHQTRQQNRMDNPVELPTILPDTLPIRSCSPLVGAPGQGVVAIEAAVHDGAVGGPPVSAHRRDLVVPAWRSTLCCNNLSLCRLSRNAMIEVTHALRNTILSDSQARCVKTDANLTRAHLAYGIASLLLSSALSSICRHSGGAMAAVHRALRLDVRV